MGRCISYWAEFAEERVELDILRRVLHHEAFQPRGLAAMDNHGPSVRWFFSGFGLEDFIDNFLSSRSRDVPSIVVDTTFGGADYEAYSAHLSDLIHKSRRGRRPPLELSPYESVDADHRVTFLNSPRLSETNIREYSNWAASSARLSVCTGSA